MTEQSAQIQQSAGPAEGAQPEQVSKQVKVLNDAFEVYEEKGKDPITEHLDTVTDLVDEETGAGRLLRVGDAVQIPDVDLAGDAVVIIVNDINTENCQTQIIELGELHREHPETPMFALVMKGLDEEHVGFFHPEVPIVMMDDETASSLAAKLVPALDADVLAWTKTGRRTAMSTRDGVVKYVEQIPNQLPRPDAGKALAALQ